MNVFSKASNVVVVCSTFIAVVLIAAMSFLIYKGRASLQDVMSLVSGLGAVGAWLYSSAGSQSAHNVEIQMNGSLDKRMDAAINTALLKHQQLLAQQPTTVPVPTTVVVTPPVVTPPATGTEGP